MTFLNSASSWLKQATIVSGTNLPPNLPNFPEVEMGSSFFWAVSKGFLSIEGVGGGT